MLRPRGGAGQHLPDAPAAAHSSLNGGQLWLRQSDRALTPQRRRDRPCASVALAGKHLTAQPGQRLPAGRRRPLAEPDRGDAGRRLAGGDWPLDRARTVRPDHLPEPPTTIDPADRPDGGRVQESFASPDTLVGLGAAGFHPPARPLGLFVDPASAAFPGPAGAAAAVRDHGAGRGRLLHAPGAPGRRRPHDRQRRGGRLRPVRGLQAGRGIRPVGRPPGGPGSLGSRRRRPDAGASPCCCTWKTDERAPPSAAARSWHWPAAICLPPERPMRSLASSTAAKTPSTATNR